MWKELNLFQLNYVSELDDYLLWVLTEFCTLPSSWLRRIIQKFSDRIVRILTYRKLKTDDKLPEQYTTLYFSLYKLIFNELAKLCAPLDPKMEEPPAFVFWDIVQ